MALEPSEPECLVPLGCSDPFLDEVDGSQLLNLSELPGPAYLLFWIAGVDREWSFGVSLAAASHGRGKGTPGGRVWSTSGYWGTECSPFWIVW